MKEQELEILNYSYWEHFKAAKELSQVLPVDHPRRVKIQSEAQKILKKIHSIKLKL